MCFASLTAFQQTGHFKCLTDVRDGCSRLTIRRIYYGELTITGPFEMTKLHSRVNLVFMQFRVFFHIYK